MDYLDKLKEISKNFTVLYAEDEEFIGTPINIILRSLFKKVTYVDNGALALEKFKEERSDIAIMDVKMPSMNGYELAMELKRLSKKLPILVTSGFIGKKMTEEFRNSGIYYIRKPFNLETLIRELYEICFVLNDTGLDISGRS